jgi:hypothetical protein
MATPQPTERQGDASDRVMLPMMRREAPIVEGSFNPEKRTFDILWTAGAEVPRMDWWTGTRYVEVLEVSDKAIRLDRLKSGRAPVLNSHSTYGLDNVMGVVEADGVRIEKGQGFARARLSQRKDIEGLVGDIRDGIIGNVSPGYVTHSYREELRNGVTYRIATDWEPVEISFVPVGADPDAGAMRSQQQRDQVQTFPCRVLRAMPAIDAGASVARMRMRQLMIDGVLASA